MGRECFILFDLFDVGVLDVGKEIILVMWVEIKINYKIIYNLYMCWKLFKKLIMIKLFELSNFFDFIFKNIYEIWILKCMYYCIIL